MDKTKLLEDLQAFYAQLLAEPKTPLNTAIKSEVEPCHRRLTQKERSNIGMASELNELLHEVRSLEHRYQDELSDQAKAILQPIRDQVIQVLTHETVRGTIPRLFL